RSHQLEQEYPGWRCSARSWSAAVAAPSEEAKENQAMFAGSRAQLGLVACRAIHERLRLNRRQLVSPALRIAAIAATTTFFGSSRCLDQARLSWDAHYGS